MPISKINTTSITDNSVTAGKIVAGAVDADIAAGSIDTAQIADDAVTADKLANAINTSIAAKLPLAGGTMTGVLNVESAENSLAYFKSTDANANIRISDSNSSDINQVGIGATGNNLTLIAGGDNRLTITSAGNVGIGVVPEAWGTSSGVRALEVGPNLALSQDINSTYYSANAYNSATGWRYKNTQFATNIRQGTNDGILQFQVAPSGSADAAISWNTAMTIDNAGITTINDATTSDYNQVLTVISKCLSRAGVYINQQNASYGHSSYGVIRNDVVRAASSAWNFEVCRSGDGSDTKFKFRGDGNAYADGTWSGGGADYAEYFEWSDGNPSNEDRRGYSVILEGNKIRQALVGETPMGVISGNPSVVGDAAWSDWDGKYLTDDFGTYILEEYTVTEWEAEVIDMEATEDTEATYKTATKSFQSDKIPADEIVPSNALVLTEDANGNTFERRTLNSDWNPDTEYVPREDRQEWDTVGLMGKLRIIKGQPVDSRWIKMRDVSDTVEEWLVR